MASRTPVVISEACHFPEVAESRAGVVTSLEPQAVAAALDRVLSDPHEAERMGAAGRQLVETRFTWERAAATALAAYDRVRPR
jgi:glycosyltransferase involved in cell wall biosynthesis